jgi:hypothetical protein
MATLMGIPIGSDMTVQITDDWPSTIAGQNKGLIYKDTPTLTASDDMFYDSTNHRIGINTTTPLAIIDSTTLSPLPTVDPTELVQNYNFPGGVTTGWTLTTGWTYAATPLPVGVKHVGDNSGMLSQSITGVVAGFVYEITTVITRVSAALLLRFAGSPDPNVYNTTGTYVFRSMALTGNLLELGYTGFIGTVISVSVKRVLPAIASFQASAVGYDPVSIYPIVNNNLFMGSNSGQFISGQGNVAIGKDCGSVLIGGANNLLIGTNVAPIGASFEKNVGIGTNILESLTTGYNNVALGYNQMAALTTGGGNTAIGVGSLGLITDGGDNLAIGTDILTQCTTGEGNLGIGTLAISLLTSGSFNIAIGTLAMALSESGSNNVFIGYSTGIGFVAGDGNVFIGPNVGSSNFTAQDGILAIHNSDTATPLVYGDFYNRVAGFNAEKTRFSSDIISGADCAQIDSVGSLDFIGDAHSRKRIRTITGATTLTLGDQVVLCNGALNVTLPTATEGKFFEIKNIGTGTVTILGTIDGATNYVMSVQYGKVKIIKSATNWYII